MKTVNEFIEEIDGSKELQREYGSVAGGGRDGIADFLKKHDVSGSVDDFFEALVAKTKQLNLPEGEGELSDDDVESVAGGFFCEVLQWFC